MVCGGMVANVWMSLFCVRGVVVVDDEYSYYVIVFLGGHLGPTNCF